MPSNSTSTMYFYAYVLLSFKDNEHYIGYTGNLRKRLEEHNSGKNFSTKSRRPLLVEDIYLGDFGIGENLYKIFAF